MGLEAVYDPGWPAGLLYIRNLVYTLASLPPDSGLRVVLLPLNGESEDRVRDLIAYPFVTLANGSHRNPRGDLFLRRLKRRYVQPRLGRVIDAAFDGLDVTYPSWGAAIPGAAQMRWVPDLQHVHLSHLFTDEQIEERNNRFALMAASPGIIVFSSQAAADDFTDIYPNPKATLRVWRFCSSITGAEEGGEDPRKTFGLPDLYLYVANQFWAHKEHMTLFRALVLLRDQGVTPTAVCTGLMEDGRDPDHMPGIRRFLEEHELNDQVRLLGMIERRDQVAVLRNAAAVVQPSRFEGWGTVVEDAKALGRPVILSNIPVHLEQAPGGAFFDVGSPGSLAATLTEVMPNLSPGPNEDAERIARAENESRREQLARLFLEIANEAIRIHRSNE